MIGLGTVVNMLAIIAGSTVGMIFKKGLSEKMEETLMKALGIATMFIGITSTAAEMLTVGEGGRLGTNGTMLMIVSLALGTVIGELVGIEEWLERLGDRLKKIKLFKGNDRFTEGFVTATLVVSIGAMAIVGSVNDGMRGDCSILFSKSILDFISTMIFASTLGIGVLLSAVPMGIYQLSITFLSAGVGELFTESMISDLSLVGSVLIFAVGINLFFGKKIRVGNMLPALIFPILYGVVTSLT